MVALAAPRAGETVIDLGSSDGRIVFAALEGRPGVRGLGVDIDAELVRKANAVAHAQALGDRARFLHQNAFDADLGKVDVIFMWLFPELMRLLRPKILAQARPGTRVIAATWDLGSWPPDAVDDQGGALPAIRKWIEAFQFSVRMTLPDVGFTNLVCVGRVEGDTIEGTIDAEVPLPGDEDATDHIRVPWRAQRTTALGYFAPTGTHIS